MVNMFVVTIMFFIHPYLKWSIPITVNFFSYPLGTRLRHVDSEDQEAHKSYNLVRHTAAEIEKLLIYRSVKNACR